MKSFIYLIGLLAFCHFDEAALLGAKKCTYGPSYWCDNIKNAKHCKAVKHCIQTVWEKTILPEDNDDVCSICKDMVNQARDQLMSNETQEEIRQVFEGACKLIPIDIIRQECIQYSDEFIPELIETLASEMNPQAVCATAGLCNSPRIDKLLLQNNMDPVKPSNAIIADSSDVATGESDCDVCTDFVDRIIKNVKQHEKNYLLHQLLAICGRLSSLSDGCKMLIETEYASIYSFITTQLNSKEACQLFGMCPRMFGVTHASTALKKSGDEPCDFCEAIVSNWRTSLVSNTTREEFKEILDGLCQHTGNFAKECLSLVDQYFDLIYDILISDIDPKEICEAVGLCGKNSIFNVEAPIWTIMGPGPQDVLPLIPLEPSANRGVFTGQDEANSYNSIDRLPRIPLKPAVDAFSLGKTGFVDRSTSLSPERVQGKNACVMCEFVLHFLQNMLQEKMTKKEIQEELDKVCKMLPKTVSEECQDYVDAYSDQVVELIIQEIDPSICPMIHLCPGLTEVKEKPTCVLCEFVMVKVDEILKENGTKEDIEKAVEKVCSLLPKSITNECNTFLQTYLENIVELLEQYPPKQVCQALNLCSNKADDLVIPVLTPENVQLPVSRYFIPFAISKETSVFKPQIKQSAVCVMCEFIMERIGSLIVKNSTEEEIKHAVEKVCNVFPASLKLDCLNFMEEYSVPIIELLVHGFDAEKICSRIKLCHAADQLIFGLPKATVYVPMDDCEICEEMLAFAEARAGPVSSGDIITGVCDALPHKEKQTCSSTAMKYGEFLVPLYRVLKDGKAVCQSLEMCPLERAKRELLGSDECTFGPSFWCHSEENARQCNATEYCLKKVWNRPSTPLNE